MATSFNARRKRTPRPSDHDDVNGSPNALDWIVSAAVLVITWPIMLLAKFLNAFVERGGAGIQALGAVMFLMGVVAGADNFYQMFSDAALLPWFITSPWVGDTANQNLPAFLSWTRWVWGGEGIVGWGAVLLSMFSITFVISLIISLSTQFIQGQSIRGKTADAAKADFEKWNSVSVPGKPTGDNKLEMATISWKQYKKVGKSQNQFIGLIAIGLWALEFVSAFNAHNPMIYVGRPGLFLSCTAYALVTIVAGELGYTLFCAAKDESNS